MKKNTHNLLLAKDLLQNPILEILVVTLVLGTFLFNSLQAQVQKGSQEPMYRKEIKSSINTNKIETKSKKPFVQSSSNSQNPQTRTKVQKQAVGNLQTTSKKRCKDEIKNELSFVLNTLKDSYNSRVNSVYSYCNKATGENCKDFQKFSKDVTRILKKQKNGKNDLKILKKEVANLRTMRDQYITQFKYLSSKAKKEWKKSKCKDSNKNHQTSTVEAPFAQLHASVLLADTTGNTSNEPRCTWGYINYAGECKCHGDDERKTVLDDEGGGYVCTPPCEEGAQRVDYSHTSLGKCECMLNKDDDPNNCRVADCGAYGEPDYVNRICVCRDDGKLDENGRCIRKCPVDQVVASNLEDCTYNCASNEEVFMGVCKEKCTPAPSFRRDLTTGKCVLDCQEGYPDGEGGCNCDVYGKDLIKTDAGSCISCPYRQVVSGEKCVGELECPYDHTVVNGRCTPNDCLPPYIWEGGECWHLCGTDENIHPEIGGTCACNEGYKFCYPEDDPDKPDNLECCWDWCPGEYSIEVAGDKCNCEEGYEWCDPDDPDNPDCCLIKCPGMHSVENGDMCNCEEGYRWCDPDDPVNIDCCLYDCDENSFRNERGNCQCKEGFQFCDQFRPDNPNCCRTEFLSYGYCGNNGFMSCNEHGNSPPCGTIDEESCDTNDGLSYGYCGDHGFVDCYYPRHGCSRTDPDSCYNYSGLSYGYCGNNGFVGCPFYRTDCTYINENSC